MSEWQPIETAPKDGTRVLLWYPSIGRPAQFGRWIDSFEVEYGVEKRRRAEWAMEGAVFSFSFRTPPPSPSHWQPVPGEPREGVE